MECRLCIGALAAILICFAADSQGQGTVIFREDFDATVAPALPPGWSSTRNRSPSTDDFQSTSSVPHSAPQALVSSNATIGQSLLSPSIPLRGILPTALSFFVRRSASHAARLIVEVSTDGGGSFPGLAGDTIRGTGGTAYIAESLPVPAWAAAAAELRFRWRVIADSAGATGTIRIDDVLLSGAVLHDLALERIDIAGASGSGKVRCDVVVANRGQEEATGFDVSLFLDADRDSIADAGERVGGSTCAGPLASGDSVAVTIELNSPGPGEWLVIAEVSLVGDLYSVNNRATAGLFVPLRTGGVAINELQYAPAVAEPEWVELFNTTPDTVRCSGWTIEDAGGSAGSARMGAGVILPPGECVVVTRDSAALAGVHPDAASRLRGLPGLPSLNNSGDIIVLRDMWRNPIDSVGYQPSWGGEAGRSLERRDPLCCSSDQSNWGTSRGERGSTPGARNSIAILDTDLAITGATADGGLSGTPSEVHVSVKNVGRTDCRAFSVDLFDMGGVGSVDRQALRVARADAAGLLRPGDSMTVSLVWEDPAAGDRLLIVCVCTAGDSRRWNDSLMLSLVVGYPKGSLVINEIMFSPLRGESEYVELVNPGSGSIDLCGWALGIGPSSGSARRVVSVGRDRRAVGSGMFALMASDSAILRRYPRLGEDPPCAVQIAAQGSLGLNNSGDCVLLLDPSGRLIDSVAYSPGWHNPGLDDPAGRSLEKISPLLPSGDRRSWTSCVDISGGTPGERNSVYAPVVPLFSGISCSPNPFSPDGDGRDDATVIAYRLPLTAGMINIRIFDVRGRMVRWLANSEPAASSGSLAWDGRDDRRRKVPLGIYIVLLDYWNDGEEFSDLKTVVVVAGEL